MEQNWARPDSAIDKTRSWFWVTAWCLLILMKMFEAEITTWYDGFLPPVRCISSPGATLCVPVVCLYCFNFVNIPPPKSVWNLHKKLNCGDIFNNDFEYFLPVIFKYTTSVPCLSKHRDDKFTRWLAHSPLLFTCQILQTEANHHFKYLWSVTNLIIQNLIMDLWSEKWCKGFRVRFVKPISPLFDFIDRNCSNLYLCSCYQNASMMTCNYTK